MKCLLTMFAVWLSAIAFAQDSIPLRSPSCWLKADDPGADSALWGDVSGKVLTRSLRSMPRSFTVLWEYNNPLQLL
jgi:hypothetical protein